MENHRVRRRRVRNDPPEALSLWRRTHKLKSYGLTQEDFDQLLEAQGHACAMCFTPFEEGQPIFIDHDHACCPDEKKSCGKCVRGLLDLSCNTALGHIERRYAMARAYLDKYEDPRALAAGRLVVPWSGCVAPDVIHEAGGLGDLWAHAVSLDSLEPR
jgi:hypothetical protein